MQVADISSLVSARPPTGGVDSTESQGAQHSEPAADFAAIIADSMKSGIAVDGGAPARALSNKVARGHFKGNVPFVTWGEDAAQTSKDARIEAVAIREVVGAETPPIAWQAGPNKIHDEEHGRFDGPIVRRPNDMVPEPGLHGKPPNIPGGMPTDEFPDSLEPNRQMQLGARDAASIVSTLPKLPAAAATRSGVSVPGHVPATKFDAASSVEMRSRRSDRVKHSETTATPMRKLSGTTFESKLIVRGGKGMSLAPPTHHEGHAKGFQPVALGIPDVGVPEEYDQSAPRKILETQAFAGQPAPRDSSESPLETWAKARQITVPSRTEMEAEVSLKLPIMSGGRKEAASSLLSNLVQSDDLASERSGRVTLPLEKPASNVSAMTDRTSETSVSFPVWPKDQSGQNVFPDPQRPMNGTVSVGALRGPDAEIQVDHAVDRDRHTDVQPRSRSSKDQRVASGSAGLSTSSVFQTALEPGKVATIHEFLGEESSGAANDPAGEAAPRAIGDILGSSDSRRPEGVAPRTDSVRPVAVQIGEAMRQSADGQRIEIKLSPEELGRVRLSMASTDAGMIVTILAERPETADLLRRHVDMLAHELRAQGHQSVVFDFSGQGSFGASDRSAPERGKQLPDSDDSTAIEMNNAPFRKRAPVEGRLDIRI